MIRCVPAKMDGPSQHGAYGGGVAERLNGSGRWRWGLLIAVFVGLGRVAESEAGVGLWTSGGPDGGRIEALAIDPQTSNVVYAATVFDGAFKSTSAGEFWSPINTGLTGDDLLVKVLAIDPQTPATVYAGTNAGVVKSTNGGESWSPSSSGLPPGRIRALAIDPVTPIIVYAGSLAADGVLVFKSLDGGANWTLSNAGLPTSGAISALAVDPQAPATIYAGTETTGVFKSTNAGASWAPRNDGLADLAVNVLTIDPTAPATLYAGTQSGGMFKSTSGGTIWSAINAGLDGVEVTAVAVDPRTTATLYAGLGDSKQVFKSTNGGGIWSSSNSGRLAEAATALAVDPHAPTTVYAGGPSFGVFKSTNAAGGWRPSNNALRLADIAVLAVDPRTPATLYAVPSESAGLGLFTSTNGGASWSFISTDEIFTLIVDPQDSRTLYAGGRGSVLKSTDGGVIWSPTTSGFSEQDLVKSLAIDPQASTTLYAGSVFDTGTNLTGRVFKSTDGGAIWVLSSSGLPGSDVSSISVAVDPRMPGTLYAALSGPGVFKSTNGAGNWSSVNDGLADLEVAAVAIDPQTPAILYAGTPSGVFKSTNGGTSWSLLNNGLPDSVHALVLDPQIPATLYAGTSKGVFRSTDGGAGWSPLNSGLTNLDVAALAINPAGTCLHAGTSSSAFDFATQPDSNCASAALVSAVLPASRSVQVNAPATAFATIINAGAVSVTSCTGAVVVTPAAGPAMTCGITQLTGLPTPFTFQETDPVTNQPIGSPNTPVTIEPCKSKSFVISLTPTAAFCSTDVTFGFNCGNTSLAPIIRGVNTLLFSASITAVPDIIALARTMANDGKVTITDPTGAGAFSVATINVGASGTITVSADTGDATLPISLSLCPTDPAALCLEPPAATVTMRINAGETPTFSVFVQASAAVPPDPARSRVFVRFSEAVTCVGTSGTVTRGATSVAVQTQ